MALQSSNKLRVYAQNGASQNPSTIMSDTDFNSNTERQTGSKPSTVINSKLTNTILKEASTVAVALVDALKQISGDTTNVGVNTDVDTLATLIKNMLLSGGLRDGIVSAGNGVAINNNGQFSVKLDITKGLAFDGNGNVYAKISTTNGLAFDANGNAYVKTSNTGITIDNSGNVTVKAAGNGITTDGNGQIATRIASNKGLEFSSGNLQTKLASDLKYSSGGGITHNNAITAGSVGPSSDVSGWGGSIVIPMLTYDSNGHITAITTKTHTSPSKPSITYHTKNNNLNTSSTGYKSFSTNLSTNDGLILISIRNNNDNRVSTAVLRPVDVTRTGGNYISASGANTTRYANLTFNVSGSTISGVTIDKIEGLSIISIAQEYYAVE